MTEDYLRPVRRLIIRWPPMKEEKRKRRPFHYACLLSTLEPDEVIRQLGLPAHPVENEDAVTLAYSTLYDKRGGTLEVAIKESTQGVGINKRSKRARTIIANWRENTDIRVIIGCGTGEGERAGLLSNKNCKPFKINQGTFLVAFLSVRAQHVEKLGCNIC